MEGVMWRACDHKNPTRDALGRCMLCWPGGSPKEENPRTAEDIVEEFMSRNIEVLENCQLEWDKDRGVLYVHNKDTGATVLRVCGLDKDRAMLGFLHVGQIDISSPTDVSYPTDVKGTRAKRSKLLGHMGYTLAERNELP